MVRCPGTVATKLQCSTPNLGSVPAPGPPNYNKASVGFPMGRPRGKGLESVSGLCPGSPKERLRGFPYGGPVGKAQQMCQVSAFQGEGFPWIFP